MASFRKPSTRTRAALTTSTAIPISTADVLEHAGEQAAAGVIAAAEPDMGSEPETTPSVFEPLVPEAAPDSASVIFETAVHDKIEHAAAPAEPGAEPVEVVAPPAEAVVEQVFAPVAQAAADSADVAVEMVNDAAERSESTGRALVTASAPQPTDVLSEIRVKVADALKTNFEDAVAYWAALANVRSLPEAMSLNAHHLHRRVEAFASQGRDMAMLVQKVAADAMDRLRPPSTR